MRAHRRSSPGFPVTAAVLLTVASCDLPNAPNGGVHPQVLDSIQVVGAVEGMLSARSFALSGVVKDTSSSFAIELAVDVGTTEQRVDTFHAAPSSNGQFA